MGFDDNSPLAPRAAKHVEKRKGLDQLLETEDERTVGTGHIDSNQVFALGINFVAPTTSPAITQV